MDNISERSSSVKDDKLPNSSPQESPLKLESSDIVTPQHEDDIDVDGDDDTWYAPTHFLFSKQAGHSSTYSKVERSTFEFNFFEQILEINFV